MRGIMCWVLVGVFVATSAFCWAPDVWAVWVDDGNPICVSTDDQAVPMIVSDGAGGGIITWLDYRSGTDYDIYAQRVNASGAVQWTADGVALCTATGDQDYATIVLDGTGGAIVTWFDYRSGTDYDVYVQRVNASGIVQWTADGVALCTAAEDQQYPTIVSDGAGGAIVTWQDYRSGGDCDVSAQRVNASGAVQWTTDGVALCTATGDQDSPTIVADGAGGAIVTWRDYRSGTDYDVYAQRVSASGAVQWAPDGVALCTATGSQEYPTITSDGAGGAIVTWRDFRSGTTFDVYAQRVDASGAVQWTANGVALCAAWEHQHKPTIVSDGTGGAIVTWFDYRGGSWNIYAQRVNASGTVQWTVDGVALCTATGNQEYPMITSDGAGGAIVTWRDYRSGTYYDVYAQRVDASGAVLWTANGVALCTATGSRDNPTITSDGAGGAIVTWQDSRGVFTDIYAHLVDRNGRLGYLPPEINSVRDVPGDQGGQVYLSWYASPADIYQDATMSHYSIWRSIDPASASMMLDNSASLLTGGSVTGSQTSTPVVRMQQLAGETYFWELVDTHDAYYLEGYGKPVATLFDSTSVCGEYHHFQVIAHTSDPKVFWISDPDSGYSVDNLPPDTPQALAGQYIGESQVWLHWNPNTEQDLEHYAIYRGTTPDFACSDETNRIGTASDTSFIDDGYGCGTEWYYKVSAWDTHENESACALLTPEMITGVPGSEPPYANALLQNMPNPFVASTRIAYSMESAGHVRLVIFDAKGRLVRVLVDGVRGPNRYVEEWDGRDTNDRPVPAGTYFYRLEGPGWRASKKMAHAR